MATPIDRESVERLAREYDERVATFDGIMDATPPSVRELRRERNSPTRQQHVDTADTLRALRAALDEAEAERHRWRQAAAKGSLRTQADLDRAAQEARAMALQEAARIEPDVEVRTDHWRHAALDQEGAYRRAILALIDTPAAEALERVQTEERAKGMERAGTILLDHPHWTRWHVLEAIRAEAAAIRAQETDNA